MWVGGWVLIPIFIDCLVVRDWWGLWGAVVNICDACPHAKTPSANPPSMIYCCLFLYKLTTFTMPWTKSNYLGTQSTPWQRKSCCFEKENQSLTRNTIPTQNNLISPEFSQVTKPIFAHFGIFCVFLCCCCNAGIINFATHQNKSYFAFLPPSFNLGGGSLFEKKLHPCLWLPYHSILPMIGLPVGVLQRRQWFAGPAHLKAFSNIFHNMILTKVEIHKNLTWMVVVLNVLTNLYFPTNLCLLSQS